MESVTKATVKKRTPARTTCKTSYARSRNWTLDFANGEKRSHQPYDQTQIPRAIPLQRKWIMTLELQVRSLSDIFINCKPYLSSSHTRMLEFFFIVLYFLTNLSINPIPKSALHLCPSLQTQFNCPRPLVEMPRYTHQISATHRYSISQPILTPRHSSGFTQIGRAHV